MIPIPPQIIGQVASWFAKPAVKWGGIAGGIVIAVVSIWTHGYTKGKGLERAHCESLMVQQVTESAKQTVVTHTMESKVVQATHTAERSIQQQIEVIRKGAQHANHTPIPVPTTTVQLYDDLRRVSNDTAVRVPPTDSRPGIPEVPRGGLDAPRHTLVQEGDESIQLTDEEIEQLAIDVLEKYALMKNAYKGFSDWNEGREAQELTRLTH